MICKVNITAHIVKNKPGGVTKRKYLAETMLVFGVP